MGYSQVVWMAEVSASSYSVDMMVNVMVASKERARKRFWMKHWLCCWSPERLSAGLTSRLQ